MFNSIKYFFAILLVVIFGAACAPVPVKPDTVVKYTLVTPPPVLLTQCSVTPPPDKNSYAALSASEKEKKLFNLASDLYSNIAVCNTHWNALNRWYLDQKKIYPD